MKKIMLCRLDNPVMSQIAKRVHIIPIAFEYDRVGRIFDEISPDRVYILSNSKPIMEHEQLNREVVNEVRKVVRSRTNCFENNEVKEIEIDFYRFEEAMMEAYRLIYRESQRGNEVYVNISGGTKPVAIALTYACSFHDTGKALYFPAESYKKEDGQVVSSGVAETPFEIEPIQAPDMGDTMPDSIEEENILIGLSEVGEIGVTDLLVELGEVSEEPPDDEEARSTRNSVIQKYHRYSRKLVEDDLLQKVGSRYALTDTGELIAKLVQVERDIEEQTSITDF